MKLNSAAITLVHTSELTVLCIPAPNTLADIMSSLNKTNSIQTGINTSEKLIIADLRSLYTF